MSEFKICKQGIYHIDRDINNQDYVLSIPGVLGLVMDGCSECKHSDVGVKLFSYHVERLFKINKDVIFNEYVVKEIFNNVIKTFHPDLVDPLLNHDKLTRILNYTISRYLLFTVLSIQYSKPEDMFTIKYLGDGYIIFVHYDDTISYIKLEDPNNEYPPYFGYKYMTANENFDPDVLPNLDFKTKVTNDKRIKYAGIASDGLRFILELKNDNRQHIVDIFNKFEESMIEFKPVKMERICNILKSERYRILQDDFSLVLIDKN
jgi:hypothetical protein